MSGDSTEAFIILACVQASVAIVLVVITLFYAKRTHDMATAMERANDLQSRSSIQLRLEHDEWNPAILKLVLENTGAGAALNVHTDFSPDIFHPLLEQKGTKLRMSELRVFQRVARLAGGQSITTFFDTSMHYFNEPSFPDALDCTVTYVDEPSSQPNQSRVVLEPRLLENMTPIWDHPMKKMSDEVAKLGSQVAKIATSLAPE